MKINKFLGLTLLALLATGCAKENPGNNGLIRIFAEKMTNGNSKVHIDGNEYDNAEWKADETINLNGNSYDIVERDGNFYLDISSIEAPTAIHAIYPATTTDGGNEIYVTNYNNSVCLIDIKSLAVNFVEDGYDVIFPMAAVAEQNTDKLNFYHLTGGLNLTISNNSGADKTVTRLVVSATKSNGDPAIYKDLSPSWATSQLPGLPGGSIGGGVDQNAQFISSMTLNMKTNGLDGVTIANTNLQFCIPMLAQGVKNISITGYNGDTEVFSVSAEPESAVDVEANHMYTIPTMTIN